MTKYILTLCLISCVGLAKADFSFSDVADKVDRWESNIKKAKSFPQIEKEIVSAKKYFKALPSPITGVKSQYKMFFEQSVALIDTDKIKSGQCREVRGELYTQFSPHKRNLAQAPEYLGPAIRLLEAACSRVKK